MQKARQMGFTLIELSIVLVIIGLIVGGVLVGQDLIRAAQVRAQISQIEKYNTAVNTFRGKYGYLPGDIKDPDASSFGLKARGSFAGEGDGNGVIEGVGANSAGRNDGVHDIAGEIGLFWVDLSTFGLIEDSLSVATATTLQSSSVTASTKPSINSYLPFAKIAGGNYVNIWSQDSVNYFGVSLINSLAMDGGLDAASGISVRQAYSIDAKIDDGRPLSGNVTAQYVYHGGVQWAIAGSGAGPDPDTPASPSTSSCYDNKGSASSNPTTYSLSQTGGAGVNCALSFQFQ